MRTLPALVIAALLIPSPGTAQNRWSLEVTTDAALPTEDLGPVDLDYGAGFGANVRYRFQPHLAAYAGWESHHFMADGSSGPDLDAEDTGYTFGMRFEHAFSSESPSGTAAGWWIRAGGLVNHIELENATGVAAGDSDHGLGWEAAAGLAWPLSGRVSLAPGLRYRRLTRDLAIGSTIENVTLAYVALGVSVVIRF